jgi:hypothetical protein
MRWASVIDARVEAAQAFAEATATLGIPPVAASTGGVAAEPAGAERDGAADRDGAGAGDVEAVAAGPPAWVGEAGGTPAHEAVAAATSRRMASRARIGVVITREVTGRSRRCDAGQASSDGQADPGVLRLAI